ncbi:hypothetical protein JXQ31_00545 [candidate division KSB1 bacterium]|nr:hypothetical protein [candidate division KSB1 bacterium]
MFTTSDGCPLLQITDSLQAGTMARQNFRFCHFNRREKSSFFVPFPPPDLYKISPRGFRRKDKI